MERLIQGLLNLPSRPALVALHAWSPYVSYGGVLNPYGGKPFRSRHWRRPHREISGGGATF